MNRWLATQRIAFIGQRLGPAGWVALVMVFVALAVGTWDVLPRWSHTHALAVQHQSLQELVARGAHLQIQQERSPTGQLIKFLGQFPPAGKELDLLDAVYARAVTWQLALDSADYELSSPASTRRPELRVTLNDDDAARKRGAFEVTTLPQLRLITNKVTLPFRGRYTAVRGFMSEVLSEYPNIAVESIYLRRTRVTDDDLECRLVLSLILRES